MIHRTFNGYPARAIAQMTNNHGETCMSPDRPGDRWGWIVVGVWPRYRHPKLPARIVALTVASWRQS